MVVATVSMLVYLAILGATLALQGPKRRGLAVARPRQAFLLLMLIAAQFTVAFLCKALAQEPWAPLGAIEVLAFVLTYALGVGLADARLASLSGRPSFEFRIEEWVVPFLLGIPGYVVFDLTQVHGRATLLIGLLLGFAWRTAWGSRPQSAVPGPRPKIPPAPAAPWADHWRTPEELLEAMAHVGLPAAAIPWADTMPRTWEGVQASLDETQRRALEALRTEESTAPSPTSPEPLQDLLLELFDNHELYDVLASLPDGARITYDLPGPAAPPGVFVQAALEQIRQRDRLDALRPLLVKARPRHGSRLQVAQL